MAELDKESVDATPNVTEVETVDAATVEEAVAAIEAPVERGEPILQVRNLVKHFPLTQGILFKKQVGAVKAVDGISFDLFQGETLGIVGESGCGKSPSPAAHACWQKATAGPVFYKGDSRQCTQGRPGRAEGASPDSNIQMVFQDPYTPHPTGRSPVLGEDGGFNGGALRQGVHVNKAEVKN
ncbi:Dipeptide ABC transporter ATP-binding protein OS=Streptomyces microflavus OX=1919 GN=G3I39_01800 PE=4 SV=1 [Streptomyces microflavus]